jgi:hypothetical protein
MADEHSIEGIARAEASRARKFGVYDAMVVIAGIALLLAFITDQRLVQLIDQLAYACSLVAAYFGPSSPRSFGPPQLLPTNIAHAWSTALWYGVQVSQSLVLSVTPVFLLIRMRRPGPPVRHLLRQPGTVAGLAIGFSFIFVVGWLHRLYFGRLTYATVPAIAAGATVAVAWAGLALSRGWRSEPTWVDRCGRLLGALAIATGIVAYLEFGI